jgi:hypothetical protein
MKRFAIAAAMAALLTTFMLPSGSYAATQSASTMSLAVLSVKPTTVTAKHAGVVFRLRVRGMTLDARHMGKANKAGQGHIQLYVDKVPKDAYTKKDLRHNWLASLAAPTFSLKLTPAILGGAGKHRIIIALAQNNYVLYRAPAVAVTITAK